ncbi:hypothetical protein SRABI98_03540 [Microbacterium sp. Bi98]|uniref:hypothetical protein n=1 Tax=Microbacterium sp. Bi98 TaxID=2821116 RepID=UPI001D9652F4|nr:hypothetical protein [Microbacterium sp. Bi98]CAH0262339.1 hypothetical protein SRABI98_03540 [Microbacterium sp. Bi98]
MTDNVEPLAFLVALTIIVGIWLSLGINARRRALIVEASLAAALHDRIYDHGLCPALWLGEDSGLWVICTRSFEHTGIHVNHLTGDIDRDG